MDKAIENFYAKPRPNVRLTILHQLFLKENKIKISYSFFVKLSKKYSKVQTVRTGAAEVKLEHIAATITNRVCNGINLYNTIAIDEKPFIPKSYLVRSARVSKDRKGPLYQSMLYGIKMEPLYLIAAINMKGIVSYRIHSKPITTEDFEAFLIHVSYVARRNIQQFLLYDNASFHAVDSFVEDALKENNFKITKTPPSGCFCDPIEKFFSIVDTKFKDALYEAVIATGSYSPLTRKELHDLINDCVYESNENFTSQFMRALL